MPFWSSDTLKLNIPEKGIIHPYDPAAVNAASYELTLGSEYFLTSDKDGKKNKIESSEQLVIPPGQFGLLITEEEIKIPTDTIAFISIKAGIKFRGLVNISGFHVDPGFHGRLKFSVYNAGSQNIVLQRCQPVFLIWFACLDKETSDKYNGEHQGQNSISANDVMLIQGETAAPSVLQERIRVLEIKLKTWTAVVLTLVLTTFGMQLKSCGDEPTVQFQPEHKILSPSVSPLHSDAKKEAVKIDISIDQSRKKNLDE
ncbi:MAG: deoxycytidine triphosphate deaminase [Verrucomicrobiota bacterium]